MHITQLHAYAVDILLTVAALENRKHTPVSSGILARANGLNRDYVAQVAAPLVKCGILHTVRGVKGGYLLGSKAADGLTVADVLRAVDAGKLKPRLESISPTLRKQWDTAFRTPQNLEDQDIAPLIPSFKRKLGSMGFTPAK